MYGGFGQKEPALLESQLLLGIEPVHCTGREKKGVLFTLGLPVVAIACCLMVLKVSNSWLDVPFDHVGCPTEVEGQTRTFVAITVLSWHPYMSNVMYTVLEFEHLSKQI